MSLQGYRRLNNRPVIAPETLEQNEPKSDESDEPALNPLNFFVERSLHTGEVVGSIPTAPTKKPLQIWGPQHRSFPFPPVLKHEQNMFPPAQLGENWGSLFDRRSHQCAELTDRKNRGYLTGRRTLVTSLEGIRAFNCFSAVSDKVGPFCSFDDKRLVGTVRTVLPQSTLSDRRDSCAPVGAW